MTDDELQPGMLERMIRLDRARVQYNDHGYNMSTEADQYIKLLEAECDRVGILPPDPAESK